MPTDMTALLADLRAEQADLDVLLDGADLARPSAAAGWSVGDCLGHLWFFDREATRELTARLRHVAYLGVRTRGFSYAVRDRSAPTTDVRVELAAPDGEPWAWGNPGAPDRVEGPALDFCLVVTQRRHLADTALVVV